MRSIVTLRGVTFELPNGRELFRHLNLSLNSGIVALVGPNGVGKTTLAGLLSGELEPTSGTIQRNKPITFFQQRLEPEAISVESYLAPDYTWSLLGERLLEGIDRTSLCTSLSGGQWMRVKLARLLDDQYLVLDEPTNDLDREGRKAVLQFLREREGGALLISHDRECLSLATSVLELSNQGLTQYGVPWSGYIEEKERERGALHHALDKATRERDTANTERHAQNERQERKNRQGKKDSANGGQPKIMAGIMKRKAQATTGRQDNATLERVNSAVREAYDALSDLKIDPVMYVDLLGAEIPAQKLVAEAVDFNIKFADWVYPRDLNFSWRGGIRIALKGGNGSGKSTLLKAIQDVSFDTRGKLRSGNLRTLYIDQRCASLDDEKNVFENIRDSSELTESEIRNGLARFLFAKDAVFQKVGSLSGGERLRTALAKGFLSTEKPECLILDEPTNNLDLANIEFLENLVRNFPGALIVVSHDGTFLENCGVGEQFSLSG